MRRLMIFAAFVLGALLVVNVAPAAATPLPPGATSVAITSAGYSGVILADTGLLSYSFGGGTETGTVREIVVADTMNPFGAGDLSFIYQFTVQTGDLSTLSAGSFGTFGVDVAQFAGSAPLAPGTLAASNATRSTTGATIDFNFIPNVNPVTTSLALIARTNATIFTTGFIGLQDTGATQVNGFAPNAPEPSSIVLLGFGLAGMLGGYSRLRRRG